MSSPIVPNKSFTKLPACPSCLLLFAAFIWDGNYIAVRALSGMMNPVELSFWRWAIACTLIAPFTARSLWSHWPIIKHASKQLVILSLLGVSAFSAFLYSAIDSTTTLNTALTLLSCPVLIPIISALVFNEKVAIRQVFAIGLSTVGVTILVLRGDFGKLATLGFGIADFWAVAAALAWSSYCALLRIRPAELLPIDFLELTGLVGCVGLLPFYFWQGSRLFLARFMPFRNDPVG